MIRRITYTLVAAAALVLAVRAHTQVKPAGQDWPQWRGANRDGVWRETGLIQKFDGPDIKVKWRVPVSNGYSGPTVANGRVYLSERLTEPSSKERVRCFDWETGKELWHFAYDCDYHGVSVPDGPRASVTVNDGRAYSLGATGSLYCFDAPTGKVDWSHDLNAEYKIRMPDWGIASAPLVEGDNVIVMISGAPNACMAAFDRKTGKAAWRALPDRATYSSPIVIDQAGKRVLVAWTADRIVGLSPESGALYWEFPWKSEGPNIDPCVTPALQGNQLFFTSVFGGALMLKLSQDKLAVEQVWAKKANSRLEDSLHTMFATPVLTNTHLYGINYFGELRCLDSKTGANVWENKTIVPKGTWASAHLIQNGATTWILNEKGQLIIAKLSPTGYTEIGRSQLIKPTMGQLNQRGGAVWSHPAFAYGHIFERNDEELVCADLRAKG
jgi:outer membrane protein assembly factor BamB